jgi:WD40 repeat protein
MPDVFISYSRRDREFVEKLHAALVARGKDVWIDFEDIPLTAEWLAEVFAGVESSDNFLFVISPDSLESEICTRELGHALEQRKRVVPVLLREADGEPVPDALASRNWTFFRERDDFDSAFAGLVEALDTDLEWVSAHTRLLQRAVEWEKEGREGSYLLRGRDLAEAERWLGAQTAERDPQPTPLQLEYTLAGRRAATRRQRQLVGAAIAAVAVSLGLALLALYQRNEARREARIALSRQLAAQAVAQLDVDPEKSLALAARAASTKETAEAADAMRRALHSSIAHAVVRASAKDVWDAQFSRDGKMLVTASDDGNARIWDARNRRAPRLIMALPVGSPVWSARFSPDGRFVATASKLGAQLWRAAPRTAAPAARFGTSVNMAAFSSDGTLVATAGDNGLGVWQVRTGRQVVRLSGRGRFDAVAFSRDGKRVVAGVGSTAAIWSVSDGRRLSVLRHPPSAKVWDVAFNPDGRQVVTGGTDGVTRVWRVSSGQQAYQLGGHTDTVQSVAFSSDGRSLLTASDDATARVWDVKTRRTVAELLGHTDSVLTTSFGADDHMIATGGADGKLRLWPSPNAPVLELAIHNGQRVRDIQFSPDGRLLVTGGEDGMGRVWDAASGALLGRLPHGRGSADWVESATFDHNGSRVVTAGDDGTAKVWDTKKDSPLATLAADGRPLRTADFSPDGASVAAAGEGPAVFLWRPLDRRLPDELGRHTSRIESVAFAPDGGSVASASWDGTVRLWQIDDPNKRLPPLRGDGKELSSVAFSSDGSRLAAGGFSGSVWVWDSQTRRLVTRLPGRQVIWNLSFSRDGRFLVTAAEDGVARVFAIASGRAVAQLPTSARSLEAAAFSPVDWRVAVAGEGGHAAVLDCVECRPFDELLCITADRLPARVLARLPRDVRDAIDTRRRRCDPR